MHKVDTAGGTKVLAEVKDLKEMAYGGLIAKGPSYAGIASDKGIRIRSIKGKSFQNLGGGVTPSPENPVEIEIFNASRIASFGHNLFNQESLEIGAIHDSTGAEIISNTLKRSGVIFVKENTRYSITPFAKRIFLYAGKKFIRNIFVPENVNTFLVPAGCNCIRIHYAIVNYTGNIMMNEGDELMSYEPYIGEVIEKDVALRSLPDGTCDEYRDGKVIRRVGRIVFDGSEDEVWNRQTDNDVIRFHTPVVDMKKMNVYYSNLICNRLRNLNNHTHYDTEIPSISGYADFQTNYPDQNWIYVLGLGNTENIRAWLQENPLEVLYPLATPTEETLSIPILPSQHPYTQVYTDSPIDTEIEWEILTSSNNDAQIDDLIARVTALESEAVSNA